ncbi:PAS domain-containing protein, partial [Vibrio sp. FNV 38]|nr:PAS domain-containing protein [Vibrio sp. FNV 38]
MVCNVINSYHSQIELEQATDFNHCTDAITITDCYGDIVTCNHALESMTGYTVDEIVGKNCSIFSNRHTPREIYHNLWSTIAKGEQWRGNLVNRRKDDSVYIADITITPIINGCLL